MYPLDTCYLIHSCCINFPVKLRYGYSLAYGIEDIQHDFPEPWDLPDLTLHKVRNIPVLVSLACRL